MVLRRFWGVFGGGSVGAEYAARECTELKAVEHCHKAVAVDWLALHRSLVKLDGHIGGDCGEELGEAYLPGIVGHFLAYCALYLGCVLNEVFDRMILLEELYGGLFAYAGATGDIVDLVAHEGKYVDHLQWRINLIFGAYIFNSAHLKLAATPTGSEDFHVGGDELSVILVGGHHVGGEAVLLRLVCECANDIVGLIAGHFNHGDAEAVQYFLDVGHGSLYVFGGCLALSLVALIRLVAECGSGRVEAHGYVGGILLLEHFEQGVEEAECRRGVETGGGDTWRID